MIDELRPPGVLGYRPLVPARNRGARDLPAGPGAGVRRGHPQDER
jgi:hypothetical protein